MSPKFPILRYVLPCALCLSPTSSPSADPVISRGAMLANTCSACHGPEGRSPGAIPTINGKSAEFITKALHDFRSGARESTVMGRHAKGYSDEEIRLIADYFSKL